MYPSPDSKLFSVTATYPDGRMVEQTLVANSLYDAKQMVAAFAVGAQRFDGEYVMTVGEFLGYNEGISG